MRPFSVREFVIQSLIATIGAFVLGTIGGLLPSIVVALLTKNPGPGNFVDRLVDQRIFGVLVGNPYFLGPIVVALVLGFLSNRVWKTNSGLWVCVLPTLILILNVFSWKSYTSRSNLADAWANYFGSDCGGSECLYEVFVTAPFYTSVAYSLGWIGRRAFGSVEAASTANM